MEPLTFIPECLPQLVAGKYKVVANLAVEEGNPSDFAETEKYFWVGAPRFTIEDSAIYSVYPPAGLSGRFESTLPHIIFNRRTLPWERSIDGKSHEHTAFNTKQLGGSAPWMALIMLSEEEIRGSGVATDAVLRHKDSLETLRNDLFAPEIDVNDSNGKNPTLDPWEVRGAVYDVIDLPLQLFKHVVPAKNDLPYLAHVRKVIVNQNKESADIGDEGYFSTLICNRLPARSETKDKTIQNTVFLVSLEGFHNYYLTENYIETKGKSKVRMVVLHSWNFLVAPGKNFLEFCRGLQVSPFKMNYPERVTDDLKMAYDYGYTLLPQLTRNGTNTYCWYRGPFNPNFLPAKPQTIVFKTADEALRFDYNTGLLDISYAAAWQLGRMLALKDKTFSSALYQWKVQAKRNAVKATALQQLSSMLPRQDSKTADQSLEDQTRDFLTQYYRNDAPMNHNVSSGPGSPGALRHLLNAAADREDLKPDIPEAITGWLGELYLLKGVPLNYLLPHEGYLISRKEGEIINEAIGTFYIDYAWMEALLGGALSIVATEDSTVLLNMVKDGVFLPDNIAENKDVSKGFIPGEEGAPVPLPQSIKGHITGYLLRSQLVSGWKGIKVFAQGEDENALLHPLRVERLSDDILLCIFSGKVQQISFIQPPEGIHFGVLEESDGFQKKMRNDDGINTDEKVKVHSSNRVLDLTGLAKNFTAAGKEVKTSAQLAFQMLESPVKYILTIEDRSEK